MDCNVYGKKIHIEDGLVILNKGKKFFDTLLQYTCDEIEKSIREKNVESILSIINKYTRDAWNYVDDYVTKKGYDVTPVCVYYDLELLDALDYNQCIEQLNNMNGNIPLTRYDYYTYSAYIEKDYNELLESVKNFCIEIDKINLEYDTEIEKMTQASFAKASRSVKGLDYGILGDPLQVSIYNSLNEKVLEANAKNASEQFRKDVSSINSDYNNYRGIEISEAIDYAVIDIVGNLKLFKDHLICFYANVLADYGEYERELIRKLWFAIYDSFSNDAVEKVHNLKKPSKEIAEFVEDYPFNTAMYFEIIIKGFFEENLMAVIDKFDLSKELIELTQEFIFNSSSFIEMRNKCEKYQDVIGCLSHGEIDNKEILINTFANKRNQLKKELLFCEFLNKQESYNLNTRKAYSDSINQIGGVSAYLNKLFISEENLSAYYEETGNELLQELFNGYSISEKIKLNELIRYFENKKIENDTYIKKIELRQTLKNNLILALKIGGVSLLVIFGLWACISGNH